MDIEIPAATLRSSSNIKRHGRRILQLETLLISLYYPSVIGSGSGKRPRGHKFGSREVWLPHARSGISKEYAPFAGLPQWLAVMWLFVTIWFTKLPGSRNAKLANHWPPERPVDEGRLRSESEKGDPPKGQSKTPTFPLVMFSDGRGGPRTAYSSVCREFASYGFVVCAVKHRDGSGARTFVNHPPEEKDSRKETETNGYDNQREKEANHRWDMIDFIFPKCNPSDPRPSNEQGLDEELRSAQIEMRLAEIEEAYNVVKAIAAGDGSVIAQRNLRNAQSVEASSRGLDGVEWDSWKGRLSTTQVTVVGYSLGAATTVEILRHADRFQWVGQGILCDVGGIALDPPESEPKNRINAPVLGINSEAFVYRTDNFEDATRVCDEARMQGSLAWHLTVRGTVHVSQSDFAVLYPRIASVALKQTIKPRRAIDIIINASLEFLDQVMPTPIAPFHRCFENEGLLDLPCIKELPRENRPDGKCKALRPSLPRARGSPRLRRRLKRFGDLDGEKEVWMHMAPGMEDLQCKGGRGCASELKGEGTKEVDGINEAVRGNEVMKGFVACSTPVWPVTNG